MSGEPENHELEDHDDRRARHSVLGEALGALSQLSSRLRATANQALDRLEDPEETLAYARRRLLERLERLRKTVAQVANADRALDIQVATLQRGAADLGERAATARASGHHDLADQARRRRREADEALASLAKERGELDEALDQLVDRCRELATRIEQSAGAAAPPATAAGGKMTAEARGAAREELTRRTAELTEAEAAAGRLEQRTSAARERAAQVASLLATGAPSGERRAPHSLADELARTRAAQAVEEELARLKEAMRGESKKRG